MVSMSKTWTIAAALAAALVVAAIGLASSTAPAPSNPRALGEYFLGPRMARAEVVMKIGNTVHDFRIDQGRVTAVRPAAIELLARDGTRQTIPISSETQVFINGQPNTVLGLTLKMNAITIRDGDATAQTLRAVGPAGGRKRNP